MPTTSTISTGKIISICIVIGYLVPPAARHKDGVPFLLHDTHALCATKVWKRCRIDASVNVPYKISQGITQLVLLLGRVHDPELAPHDICRPAGARWESVRNFCLQVVGISHVCGTVPSCGSMKRDAQNIARDFAGDSIMHAFAHGQHRSTSLRAAASLFLSTLGSHALLCMGMKCKFSGCINRHQPV